MSTSNNLNKPKSDEPITKRISRALLSVIGGTGNGTPAKAPVTETKKEEPQPQAEAPKESPTPVVVEKKQEDQPIYGRRSTRPFIPNPLGG